MKAGPLGHQSQRTRWELSSKHTQGTDVYRHFVTSIPCVKMWWIMIIVEHRNDDPVKAADFRHCNLQQLQTYCDYGISMDEKCQIQ